MPCINSWGVQELLGCCRELNALDDFGLSPPRDR
jgi:hypothetical protein